MVSTTSRIKYFIHPQQLYFSDMMYARIELRIQLPSTLFFAVI